MGLLILAMTLMAPFELQAAPSVENIPVEIIVDPGNLDNSVGAMGEVLVETGTLYEDFQVIGFEPEAIIVKENQTQDVIKWPKEKEVSPATRGKARRFFVVKQMKAIYQAQMQYVEKFEDQYASELDKLIDHGLLADGFKDHMKENYLFRILSVGLTKRLAIEAKRQPTFLAVAEPKDPEADPWYFSVDELGQVRYARTLQGVSWGPVWDYNDFVNAELPSTVIKHQDQEGEG